MTKSILSFATIVALLSYGANALEYNGDNYRLKLNASGNAGIFQADPFKEKSTFLGDWEARAEFDYNLNSKHTFGLVYAIDSIAIDEDLGYHEAFALWQVKNVGRMELGITSSVARKLGIGLPDVGGLRVNEEPLVYKKIAPNGPIISESILSAGHNHDALRMNLVGTNIQNVQYGLSVAGLSDDFKYNIDGAVKFKKSDGKLKTALSVAASFMDKPDGLESSIYSPEVFADFRAQASVGLNIQYNSLVWGTSVRGIYDSNPQGEVSDGLAVGSGFSYDFLQLSASVSYLLSSTGIWHNDAEHYYDNTVIGSLRYKFNEYIDMWLSVGTTSKTPFLSTAFRIEF